MADDRDAMIDEVGAAILGPPVHDRHQAAAAAGLPLDRADRLWRAMGFPDPPDGAVLFTERDVEAMRATEALRAYGVVDEAALLTLTRSMAQSLSRLAVSHAATAFGSLPGTGAQDAEALVPAVGSLLDYVWRRHLAAAVEGVLVTAAGERAEDRPVAVGFADLVGFTELSRQAAPEELAALVERFESTAAQAVAAHGGRVVKTLGDEVLFTAGDAGAAAALGLDLAAAAGGTVGREVRVGLAYGPVLARLGDVFGPTVNIASRLTGLARPGTVLADREAAAALRGDPRYVVAPLRRQSVRGYAHLAPFRVRSATGLSPR